MNDSVTQPDPEKPSATRAFLSGFATSSLSGAVMMGIVAVLGVTAAAFGWAALPLTWGGAALMTAASGIFGGVMSAIRPLISSALTPFVTQDKTTVAMPLMTQTVGPVAALSVPADQAEQAPTKNWAAETARHGTAQSRVQQILANGALSDGDRANAILEARATPTASASLSV